MRNSPNPAPTLAAQLATLPQLPQDRLWALWDEHFPRRPKRVHRRYLEARLAYRLQEIALGGLPPAVKAHLADYGEQHSKIKIGRSPEPHLMPRHDIDPRMGRLRIPRHRHIGLIERTQRMTIQEPVSGCSRAPSPKTLETRARL